MAKEVARQLICSECPNSIYKPGETIPARPRKTCGDACRKARSRRLRKANNPGADAKRHSPEEARIAKNHRSSEPDAIHEVLKEELRPIVRENLTQDTLRGIADAVELVPEAIAVVAQSIRGDDAKLAFRGSELLLKYTLGHPALVPPEQQDTSKQIVVNFGGMSRPEADITVEGEEVADGQPVLESELELEEGSEADTRECDNCGATKKSDEFVEESDRCITCFDAQQKRQQELLDGTA